MDEYANEAAAQAEAMDVYSLISTEQDLREKNVCVDENIIMVISITCDMPYGV